MTDHGDDTAGSRVDGACPECGSAQSWFRVRRAGAPGKPLVERSLVWECRACGARWTERLVAGSVPPDPIPDSSPP
jgi:DNA-directed RNA polymerase subunit M/transcription elongation factor TFIIS